MSTISLKNIKAVTYRVAVNISKMAAWGRWSFGVKRDTPNISVCHVINSSDMIAFSKKNTITYDMSKLATLEVECGEV